MEPVVSKRSSYKKNYASLLTLAFFCGCTTTHTQEESSSGGAKRVISQLMTRMKRGSRATSSPSERSASCGAQS